MASPLSRPGTTLTPIARNERLSVLLHTDAPGRVETPALPHPRISIHAGRSGYLSCERAGLRQRGLRVYGDMEIVPAETACVWEPEGPDTALILGISNDLVAATAEELGVSSDKVEILNRFQARDVQIEHMGWALKSEMEAGFPSGRLFRDGMASALAISLLRRHSTLRLKFGVVQESLAGRQRRNTIAFIEDNLGRDLSLSSIAAAAGVGISQLKAGFRRSMGVSVHQYVIQRRVERARELLAEGTLSITQVALETGFAHQSHLALHMRRLLGVSPGELRKAP